VLVVYDTCLTYSEELQFLWKRKPCLGTYLYLFARYFGILSLILGFSYGVENFIGTFDEKVRVKAF
jgi:hypothetical protein